MSEFGDIRKGPKLKALIFGKFKVGKTVGAATWPRPNFLCFDQGGMLSLTNPEVVKYNFAKQGIQWEYFHDDYDGKGIVSKHHALDDASRYFDRWMDKKNVDKFDTWVIDSGSSLSEAARNKGLILLDSKGMPGVQSKTWELAKQYGVVMPKLQDFGAERSMVEQFIKMVNETDKHLLLLCHEKELWEGEGDAAKVVGIVPLFTGQSAELIPVKFDEVYNLRTKKEGPKLVRYLQTQPDGLRSCGSRLGLPDGTIYEYPAVQKALNL